ncbi:MAG TPA: RNA polymerase sigma factor [Kofleriaceae bacterium]|nr:RNA polymerase sigma factor [Kofleriaceae bacterium]
MSDRNRLCRLLEPHHDELRAFAHRLCRATPDGDDLFQEAAVRALVKLDGLRSDDAFRFWFYRVLLSVHRNRTRRGFWSRLVPLGEALEPSVAPVVSAESIGGAERMREALSSLPPVQREAIVLYELQELSVEDIAELQGVSASAVKSRLSRGRARLRAVYRKRFAHAGAAPAELLGES